MIGWRSWQQRILAFLSSPSWCRLADSAPKHVVHLGPILVKYCCLLQRARRRMSAALRSLYSSGAWLNAEEAAQIGDNGVKALRAIGKCAQLSVESRDALFPLHAKMHMLFHQFNFLQKHSKLLNWVESPLTDECQQDESFVGVVSRLSRRVSPSKTIHRCLDLYLCLLQRHWDKVPEA